MEELNSLVVGLALLIVLAVTSMRYGVDSRDGFRGRREERAPRGIVWDVPVSTPRPLKAVRKDDSRPIAAPGESGLAPCAA